MITNKIITFKPVKKGGRILHFKINLHNKHTGMIDYETFKEIENGAILSICGSFRANGCFCQTNTQFKQYIDFLKESDQEIVRKLIDIWGNYHLNDLVPGCKLQEDTLIDFGLKYDKYTYEKVCNYLNEKDVLYCNGYKYGSSWLYKSIPEDVISFLQSL